MIFCFGSVHRMMLRPRDEPFHHLKRKKFVPNRMKLFCPRWNGYLVMRMPQVCCSFWNYCMQIRDISEAPVNWIPTAAATEPRYWCDWVWICLQGCISMVRDLAASTAWRASFRIDLFIFMSVWSRCDGRDDWRNNTADIPFLSAHSAVDRIVSNTLIHFFCLYSVDRCNQQFSETKIKCRLEYYLRAHWKGFWS